MSFMNTQTPYVSSTPVSHKNQFSISFSNLSEIDDIDVPNGNAKKQKIDDDLINSTTNLSHKFTLASHLTPFFTNLNISGCTNGSASTLQTFEDVSCIGVQKNYNRIRKGQDYNFFRPRKMEGIYNSLIINQNYKKEVYVWIQHFQNDHNSAIAEMIQFVADICGYQEFDITTIWKSKEMNILELVNYMEENPPKIQMETGRYLFKGISDWAKYIQTLIYKFVQYLLEVVHEEDIDFANLVVVFALIIGFSNSMNRSMRHTAVAIIAKWNTILLTIRSKTKLTQYDDHLSRKFSVIIENNCNIQDPNLDLMKAECAEEMFLWFCTDPSLFCGTKFFNRLMRFVQNQSKKLRKAALKTCYRLVTTEQLGEHLKPVIKTLAKVVGGRVCDIDYNIAISAVKICTILLDKYDDVIEDDLRNKIIYLVFGNHCLLAMASGEFLMKHLKAESEKSFLVTLVCFVYSIKKNDYIIFLVEAILDCCPLMLDWATMIDTLLDDSSTFNPELQTILICIMSESVQQYFAGKSKIPRMKSYERQFKVTSEKITNIFIDKISRLLKKYKKDSLGLQMLLEILFLMDLKFVLTTNATEIDSILSSLRPIFVEQTDKDALESISKYLSVMCGNNISLIKKCEIKIQTLKLAIKDAITNFMKQSNKKEVEIWLLRVLSLFKHHDLTGIMQFSFFMESVEIMKKNDFSSNAIQHSLKCCYQHLKWRLKYIINNALDAISSESLNEDIAFTKKAFDQFTHCCFNLMTENQEPALSLVAFECICKVYTKFRQDLKLPTTLNDRLSVLTPFIKSQTYIRQFMNYAYVTLFEATTKDTLFTRRFLMGKVFDLIHLNVIGFTESSKLYQCYYSHHDDYGDIFKTALNLIHEVSDLAYVGIILQSLIYIYSQYLLVTAKNEPQEDIFNNLQNLSKQFQLLMNRSTSNSQMLLNLGIRYAASSDKHYMFFDILKVFSKPLSTSEKRALINTTTAAIPEANRTNRHVQAFLWYLENKEVQQRKAVRVDSISSSITRTNLNSTENYNISFSSTDS